MATDQEKFLQEAENAICSMQERIMTIRLCDLADHSPKFTVNGKNGETFSFREEDGSLILPVNTVDNASLIAQAGWNFFRVHTMVEEIPGFNFKW